MLFYVFKYEFEKQLPAVAFSIFRSVFKSLDISLLLNQALQNGDPLGDQFFVTLELHNVTLTCLLVIRILTVNTKPC